ncbi:hypothetical protein GCM10009839_45370 [Catenulispora yoronensis]|uniref:Guanylate cyclase domain-containing protein n=1 Tax=Catenulispora yoronensis TaxID=450799 RepID=A0ABP5G1R9_9ACTN
MGDPLGADGGRQFGRRLLLLVDAKGYGAGSQIRQREFQEAIPRLVNAAAHAAALRYADWEIQAQGDALFAVLPEGTSEPALVDTFTRALEAGLRNYNESRLVEAWLRLRVAIHYGPVSGGDLGFVGPGPVELARVNGCEALRTALAEAPEAHLAVGVTAPIYGDVIRPGYTTLRPVQFRQAEVVEKEYRGAAWIWVPHAAGTPDAGSSSSPSPSPAALPPGNSGAAASSDAANSDAANSGTPAHAGAPMYVSVHNHDFDARGAVIGIKL